MRSTAILILLVSFFGVGMACSQSTELVVEGQGGKLYLTHSVVAKETWYSIGRLYNIAPKEVSSFNGLTMDKPLSIGQELKVPLTAVNFSQTGLKAAPAETLVPVYHIIQEKEWMYRISVNHNKVPIPKLEKWNNINKDQVKAGMHLIVGYLKVKTALSALAAGAGTPTSNAVAANPPANVKTEAPAKEEASTKTPGSQNPAPPTTHAGDKHPVEKPVTAQPSGTQPSGSRPVPPPSGTQAVTPQPSGSTASSSLYKPVTVQPSGSSASLSHPSTDRPAPVKPMEDKALAEKPAGSSLHFNGGFFSGDFAETGKSLNGPASTFKSTSGWQDGKYYALMNNVPVGTIVKITVSSTNKTVYAKILGQLPDMKESAGLTVRMSNAAAGELGEGESRFNVEVKY
ncbi:MAG TPA: LysM peptidoglycan-binding domain-containing protein [Puia sp.]|nr:LysM peptidoglycan-binding domain-containing protein [Puia sp.]